MPMICGGGGGGARAAIRPAFARCRRTDSLWKSWRDAVSDCDGEWAADCFAMARKWKMASPSQPPRVSTTSGIKATPFIWHGRKCLFILTDFMAAIAAPGDLWDWGRAVWLSGEVTAISKAVCLPRQFCKKMSPGQDWELATTRASFTGERPACFADSKIASQIISWRWIRSSSEFEIKAVEQFSNWTRETHVTERESNESPMNHKKMRQLRMFYDVRCL